MLRAVACVVVVVTIAAAARATAEDARARFVVRIGSSLAPDSLDPALGTAEVAATIEYATCLKLVNFRDREGPAGTTPVPEAAVALPRVSRDGRTYTFTVRRGLRFSDGRPLTAATYGYTLQRMLDPRMGSIALRSHAFDDIVGVRERARGAAQRVSGITVRGRTLTIRLTRRAPDIVTRLGLPVTCPVPIGFPIDPAGVERPAVPGSGPYTISSYRPGLDATLVRNRFYRGSRPRRPDEIRLTFGASQDELTTAVEQGRLDYVIGGPSTDRLGELTRRYGVGRRRLQIRARPQTFYLVLNTRSPLFRNNASLRRAIGYALDRPAVVRASGNRLLGRPTDQLLPPSMPGYVDRRIYPVAGPSLTEARRLTRGRLRARRATLYVSSSPAAEARGRAVAEQLARIGLQVEVRSFGADVFIIRLALPTEPYDMAIMTWLQDWPDPMNFIGPVLHSRSIPYGAATALQWNYARFKSARLDARIDAASRLAGRARAKAFSALEADMLRNDAPILPLYYANDVLFSSLRLGCVTYSSVFTIDYAALCRR